MAGPALITVKTPDQVKATPITILRKDYTSLANEYKKYVDGEVFYCHKCGKYYKKEDFYSDASYKSGLFPMCKQCVLAKVEQRDNKYAKPNETKESVQSVLQMMDLPYIDSFYEDCIKHSIDGGTKRSPFGIYLPTIKSLPNWKGLRWKDSEFGVEQPTENFSIREPRREIRKIFGSGFANEDYLYLQDQYDDWTKRTQVDTKSQETYIVRICFKLLEIWKAQKQGKDTSNLDKSLNDLMAAANLQPKQNVSNAASDSLTFGQLIEKWEEEEPIPEPSAEFKDVDGIGKYIRVWFAGHLAKALGLRNAYTKEYDDEVAKYTVTKLEASEDGKSDDIYETLFGKSGE